MKKIVEISNVLGIERGVRQIICFRSGFSESIEIENLRQIEVADFFISHLGDKGVVYQEKNKGDLFVLPKDESKFMIEGEFSIYGAFNSEYGVALIKFPEKSYYSLDIDNRNLDELGFLYNYSYSSFPYLFQRKKGSIGVFNCSSHKEKSIDLIPYLKDESDRTDEVIGVANEKSLLVRCKSGQLVKLVIDSGEVDVISDLVGRSVLFDNKLFSVTGNFLQELDSDSGAVLQEENIAVLTEKYGFYPTGKSKVYLDYIFLMSAGKPGMVAIFDRTTLKFKELLELESMIPIGTSHLHWHDEKLFILDSSNTLHIFEKE